MGETSQESKWERGTANRKELEDWMTVIVDRETEKIWEELDDMVDWVIKSVATDIVNGVQRHIEERKRETMDLREVVKVQDAKIVELERRLKQLEERGEKQSGKEREK